MKQIPKIIAGIIFVVFASFWAGVLFVSTIQGVIAVPADMSATRATVLSFLLWLSGTNHVVASLLCFGLYALGFGILFWHPEKGWAFYFEETSVTGPRIALAVQRTQLQSAIQPATSKATATPAPQKVFTNRTAEELFAFFNDHTNIQANVLLKPYIGLWMRVSGVSSHISSGAHYCSAFLATDGGTSANIYCIFSLEYESHFLRILKGDILHVAGRITEINSYVVLQDCEFTSPQRSMPQVPGPLET